MLKVKKKKKTALIIKEKQGIGKKSSTNTWLVQVIKVLDTLSNWSGIRIPTLVYGKNLVVRE